jgi:hypothetical protein
MEAMVEATLDAQTKTGTDTAKRIIIVEEPKQIDRLRISGTARFALVLPDGSLTYFKGS